MKKEELKRSDNPDNLCVKILRYIVKCLVSTPFIILGIFIIILGIFMDIVAYPILCIGYIFYTVYKFSVKEEIMTYKEFVKWAEYDGFIYNWLKK